MGVALALGALLMEWMAWRNRLIVGVPHFAVGCAIIGSGCIAWVRVPWSRVGLLLVLAGAAWFIGALGDGATDSGRVATSLAFLYLGVLLHVLGTYPSGRSSDAIERLLILLGYLLSIAAPLWRSDAGLVAVGILIGVGVVVDWRHRTPTERREAAPATWLGITMAVLILTMPAAHAIALAMAQRMGVRPWDTGTLAASVASLLVACGLTWSLVRLDQRRTLVADLVIELGAGHSTGLAAELRRVLGDPGLTIGIWRPETGRFEDDTGDLVAVPESAAPGVAIIDDRGHRVAVVLHDPTLTDDPGLRAALIQSARMVARNTALRQRLGSQADQLAASRRRLLEAADAQRRVLDERLRRGPAAGLERAANQVEGLLRGSRDVTRATDPHLEQAVRHLSHARRELDAIGRGLDPGSVASGGIISALHDLAARNPVPVILHLPSSLGVAGVVASTIYFTTSEALANVTRHAHASRAWLRLEVTSDRVELTVEDDGTGGVDVMRGTGLRGLRDRLEALGGSLSVGASAKGVGTRLVAELPVVAGRSGVGGLA